MSIRNKAVARIKNKRQCFAEGGLAVGPVSEPVLEQPTQAAQIPSQSQDEYISMSDQEIERAAKDVQTYGDRWLETAGITALGQLSGSAIPRLLQNIGAYEPGEIAKMQEVNTGLIDAETAGDIAGLGLGLMTGGEGLLAKGMQKSAVGLAEAGGVAAEKVVSDLLKKSANKTLNKEIIRKSVEHATRGAVEGATLSLSDLANEDALGKAEFNAENVLGHVGMGGLMNGIASAALPGIGAGLKAGYRGGEKLFEKSIAVAADPVKDTLKLMGYKPAEIADIVTSDSKKGFREGLVPWLKRTLGSEGISKSDDTVLESLNVINKTAQKEADNIIAETSALVNTRDQIGLVNKGKEVFGNMLDNVNRVLNSENTHGFSKTVIDELVKFRDTIVPRINSGKAFDPSDYRAFRQKLDKLAKWGKEGSEHPIMVEVARENRKVLSDAMHDLVNTIDPEKAVKLKNYFEDMHYSIDMIDRLGDKVGRADATSPFGWGRVAEVAGLIHLGGGVGGAIAAGKAFLQSDLKRRLVIMQAIRKAGQKTEAATESSISKFLKGEKPKKATMVSALMASALSRPENKKDAPKNKQEAYQNTFKNLQEFSVNPEKLLDRTAKSTASISREAPNLAAAASQRMINATQFLVSKIPKNPNVGALPGVKPRPYEPSSMELSKFERYLQVVEAPLTVLRELESGTLTRDHVEAMQAVYPEMYNYFRNTLIHQLENLDNAEMPYQQRVQAGLLLDIVSDSSMLGHNIQALQANFKVQEQPEGGATPVVKPTQGGAANIDKASRTTSDTQAFMKRRAEN